jgi:predicted DNA binding protein
MTCAPYSKPKITGRSTNNPKGMREFVCTILYDEGTDRLMDLLIDTPEARSTALLCAMSEDEIWRLIRFAGPTETVERAKSLLLDDSFTGLSVSDRNCDGTSYTDVLEETSQGCVLYTRFHSVTRCDAVSLISARYLSGGALFEATRHTNAERWRILMEDDEKVGMLYDTLGAKLRDGLSFRFEHLEDVTDSPMNPFTSLSIRPEQRRVLEIAAEHGYYETPRETTLDEIATVLDIPRSTVSYRLRRAEAELIEEFLSAD